MQTRWIVALAGLCIAGRARADYWLPDELRGPTPELMRPSAPVALPRLPIFVVAPLHDGYHTPLELRQRGTELLGQELVVKGFVTGIYDCVADLSARHPGLSRDQLVAEIDRDISVCQIPRFYLGQSETMPRELAIPVVDVPRSPSRRETKDITEADYLRWPKVPRLVLNDYVGVTGTWALASPRGERDVNGLVVYHSLVHEPPAAEARAVDATFAAVEPDVAVETKLPLRRLIGNERWNRSVDHLNACTRAVAAHRFDSAIADCQLAIRIWADNHLAWYGLASAELARSAWADAITPARHAVQLRPDQAMYQLYYGIALYQAAHGDPQHPASVLPPWLHVPMYNAQSERLELARDAFRRAVKLMPKLWRARYFLARSELEHGEAAMAASQLDQAIALNPSYAPAYVALAELYLRWGYRAQAREVVEAGTHRADAQADAEAASELWYELGTIDEADHAFPAAVEAYGKVLARDPDNVKAHLGRGRLLIDAGKPDQACKDLRAAAATADPELVLEKQLANQLLWTITKRWSTNFSKC